MTVTGTIPTGPEALAQRVAQMGAAAVTVRRDGRVQCARDAGWLVRNLVRAANVRAMVRAGYVSLVEDEGGQVELFPGFTLVALRTARRRRDREAHGETPAALILSQPLLESEAFHRACGLLAWDVAAVSARVKRQGTLLTLREAQSVAMMVRWLSEDGREIDARRRELQTVTTQLSESYEELSLLYRAATGMTFDRSTTELLRSTVSDLTQVLDLGWMALWLSKEGGGPGVVVAGAAPADEATLRRIGAALADRVGAVPRVVEDVASLELPELTPLASSVLLVSLRKDDRRLGVLIGADKRGGALGSVEAKLCDALASSLSMHIENRVLYDDTQAMFFGTLQALTRSIDAKDRYTRGHSERVATMARMLARSAGLPERQVERVYLSGLLHDVGKIGVPESVLTKPGKLTPEEFDLVKQHPAIGARILADIPAMADLVPGVIAHHERYDGKGYPHGLAGESIPLFGRLIALADSFDAMSSTRTYRPALDPLQVLAEIERCAGSQFDPELARRFVRLDFGVYAEMARLHERQHQALLNGTPA